jgi:hypothetical protein
MFKVLFSMVTLVLATSAVGAVGAMGAMGAIGAPPESPADVSKKFVTLDTRSYTLESPEGWVVSEETPFGQREIHPRDDARGAKIGAMSAMTGAGLGRQDWEQLYRTSLFYITRSFPPAKFEARPFTLLKTRKGYDACTWTMEEKGTKRVAARYVILKSTTGNILALSVKVPASAERTVTKVLDAQFQHLVDTAVVK